MNDDVNAFHTSANGRKIIAVDLVKFDAGGNVVELTAHHAVDANDLVAISEECVGKVAPKETSHAGDEDPLSAQRYFSSN